MSKINQSLEFLSRSKHGLYTKEILSFYVPLALSLPQTRENPELMQKTIKSLSNSGISDVATRADEHVQREVKKQINSSHPEWQFWGEEGADNTTEYDLSKRYLLIIDPIEGTNNFIAGKDDQWGSVIALVDIKTKEPVIGIVSHPSQRQFYVGIKDGGAYVLTYDQNYHLENAEKMNSSSEYSQFTYNNSPHFNEVLALQVERFIAMGEVVFPSEDVDNLEKSRIKVLVPRKGEVSEFVDPESGALEVIRYSGTIYFKTSNEMAAVFVILHELDGWVTDASGKAWTLGINTLVAARNQRDYLFLKDLLNKARDTKKK